MSEFAFELELCATVEAQSDGIVSRQLGAGVTAPGGRIVDVVRVDPGPAFEDRLGLTPETIPQAAIDADVGPGRARPVTDAFECHPNQARRIADRAVEIGFFERERRAGREYVRQVARYPDWFGRLTGIENKPDLGSPGALATQLRTDVSLAVFDSVILATESYVTGAHLHRLPSAVGVWRVHREETPIRIEVVREPSALPTEKPGIEPLAEKPGRTDVAVVSPAAKARTRRRIAERAYGKGWRTFSMPACGACDPTAADRFGDDSVTLPYCRWAGRLVDAESECGPDCSAHDPAPPVSVDTETQRASRTPWVADPPEWTRRQASLDRFE